MTDAFAAGGLWAMVSDKLEAQLGLRFGLGQDAQLQFGLKAAAPRFGCSDATSCARWLLAHALTADDRQWLARHLAIGETYFFRDEACFRNLREVILPALLHSRREAGRVLKIWSAGCSTGEEPYSLAMLLACMIPDWRDWNISILATDINTHALAKARAGEYGSWSRRLATPDLGGGYLIDRGDGRVEVDPEVRTMVKFACVNLVEDTFPSAATSTTGMDLILCRNVLIYFDAARALRVLEALGRALSPEGWLLTSAVEVPLLSVGGLQRAKLPGITALRPMADVAPAGAIVAPTPREEPVPPHIAVPKGAIAAREGLVVPEPGASRPAIQTAPEDGAGTDLAALARDHADKGDLTKAAALCSEAMQAGKQDPHVAYLMATILMEQGEWTQASAALRRTLYLSPGHVLAHVALGGLARRQGDHLTSRRHFSAALLQLPSDQAQEVLAASGGMSASQLRAAIVGMGGRADAT